MKNGKFLFLRCGEKIRFFPTFRRRFARSIAENFPCRCFDKIKKRRESVWQRRTINAFWRFCRAKFLAPNLKILLGWLNKSNEPFNDKNSIEFSFIFHENELKRKKNNEHFVSKLSTTLHKLRWEKFSLERIDDPSPNRSVNNIHQRTNRFFDFTFLRQILTFYFASFLFSHLIYEMIDLDNFSSFSFLLPTIEHWTKTPETALLKNSILMNIRMNTFRTVCCPFLLDLITTHHVYLGQKSSWIASIDDRIV